jgi:hypothetical protein
MTTHAPVRVALAQFEGSVAHGLSELRAQR